MRWQLDKDKYKKQIDNSPLFSLNKELEPTAYKRESYKMIENVVGYMLALDDDNNKEYGMEIAEVAKRCIKYYDTSRGSYLSYFLSSWRIELGRLKAKETTDRARCGGHITEEDKRNIKKLIKYAQMHGLDYCSIEFIKKASEAMELPVGEIQQLIQLSEIKVVSDYAVNDEGEEFSLIDLRAAEETTYEEQLSNISAAVELLKKVEEAYLERQERQKPLLSKLLTSKIMENLDEYDILYEEALKLSFFDNDMYTEYRKSKVIPTARDIALSFNITEQSVSRTLKMFREILKR